MRKYLKEITSYEKRKQIFSRGRNLVDTQGIKRIINIITKGNIEEKEVIFTLRPVEKKDCYDLWKWRNHPEVRKWCFNSENIIYSFHKEWFENKLNDENTLIYIAENNKKDKLGQVRIETNQKRKSYININLNPRFFNKGMGSKLIHGTTNIFFKTHPYMKEVIAEIIPQNIISQRAFQKAGYLYSGEKNIKEKKVLIFKFINNN
jgi:RimJ/RimL family protein N-acetyltransferase